MRKSLLGIGVVALVGAAVGPLTASAATASAKRAPALRSVTVPSGTRVAAHLYDYAPKASAGFAVKTPTVKFFTETEKTAGKSFTVKQIGTAPSDSAHPTSTISVKLIPLALKFTDGVTVDPTATLPSCAGGGTAVNRTVNSGLFKNVNTHLGPSGTAHAYQFLEEFRRSEYWFNTPAGPASGNPNYSVRLSVTVLPKTTVSVTGPSAAETCGRGGNITIDSYDNYLRNTLFPSYGTSLKTTDLAFVLTSNIVLCGSTAASSCGIGGYHNAYQRGSTQTYGTGEFATDKRFHNAVDTVIASHEFAEWLDDPFVDNATPAWGHIGQVSGCQNNLEVGDPLTGTLFNLTTTTGKTTHVQDLAAVSWFYRKSPSISVDRKFSLFDTFGVASKPCS